VVGAQSSASCVEDLTVFGLGFGRVASGGQHGGQDVADSGRVKLVKSMTLRQKEKLCMSMLPLHQASLDAAGGQGP
jgi:hypothetical protein